MALNINCEVCFEPRSLSSIRVFPTCGHGFCTECIEETRRYNANKGITRPPCPMCRVPFRPSSAIQIYLQDTGQAQAAAAIVAYTPAVRAELAKLKPRMKRLNQEFTEDSVSSVARQMTRVINAMKADTQVTQSGGEVQNILSAMSKLINRVSPLFAENAETERLREQVDQLEANLDEISSKLTKVTDFQKMLRKALEDAEHQRGVQLEKNKRKRKELADVKAELEETVERLRDYKDSYRKLKDAIRSKDAAGLWEHLSERDVEMMVLNRRLEDLRRQSEDENDDSSSSSSSDSDSSSGNSDSDSESDEDSEEEVAAPLRAKHAHGRAPAHGVSRRTSRVDTRPRKKARRE
ncbi:hypothetical protein BXZ70DRAFT_923617 [Cristinia sonorae]|uniref:RING-type domain-containing protein n=1 Tax=Cristinia sonorae TaxID=1940300 RepID=A0A8K0XT53_9AGAR|nr:hypothetical protein BXZ70DRAFT_923617 [Cristinia sonorae]